VGGKREKKGAGWMGGGLLIGGARYTTSKPQGDGQNGGGNTSKQVTPVNCKKETKWGEKG